MRITILQGAFLPVPNLKGGAVEKIWFELGKEFVRQGHEVTHISRRFGPLPNEEVVEGVRHIRIQGSDFPSGAWRQKFCDLRYTLAAREVLPVGDILVTNTFFAPISLRKPQWGKLYVHVARTPRGQYKYYKRAARIQAVSESVAEKVRGEEPELSKRICAIGNPLANQWFSPARLVRAKNRVLYAGRVHPEKGLDILVEAVNILVNERSIEADVEIVGPWKTDEGGGGVKFLEALKAKSQGARINWSGLINTEAELISRYDEASVFVYPSIAEGETFGLAPLEAMSRGCITILSDLPCFRDYAEPSVNCLVFDHRSADRAMLLAARLGEAFGLQDGGAMQRAAVKTAQGYDLEKIARLFLDDFESLSP